MTRKVETGRRVVRGLREQFFFLAGVLVDKNGVSRVLNFLPAGQERNFAV